jgi:DNA-binding transcriptional LysR family regulator
MKRSNFNLMVCLDALLTERSVTRAAQRLEMSQPGMSNALARLRQLTGDPLLIRSGNGFRLSERAEALAQKVRDSLALMDEIFADEGPLDLGTATGTVTIAAADSVGIALIPSLAQALAEKTPHVRLDVRLPDPQRLREWLGDGECDIAIGHFPEMAPDLRSTNLFTQSLSCIRSSHYPQAGGKLTLDAYLQATHVAFGSPFSQRSTMESTIDSALGARGLERKRMVRVSSVMMVPYVVAGSQHIATLPTWMARHLASFLPLALEPLPFEVPPIESRMVWHERTHRLGLQQWLRELIRELTRELGGAPRRGKSGKRRLSLLHSDIALA